MYVCMRVTKVVIVNNGKSIRFFFFLHEIEWVSMVLRILNLEVPKRVEKCKKKKRISYCTRRMRDFFTIETKTTTNKDNLSVASEGGEDEADPGRAHGNGEDLVREDKVHETEHPL